MISTEIERKFTIKYLPKEIETIKKITQKHIFKDMVCSIRVRESIDLFSKEKIYTHTIKARGENTPLYSINEEEYKSLKPFKGSRIIRKYRVIIPLQNNLKVEVDVFDDWIKGLVIAEVEFKNVNQAKNFKMPEWFEKSVPHKEYSNRMLSTKSREEILDMVGKKQLERNRRIFKTIEKYV